MSCDFIVVRALRLGSAQDTSPEFWLNAQKAGITVATPPQMETFLKAFRDVIG